MALATLFDNLKRVHRAYYGIFIVFLVWTMVWTMMIGMSCLGVILGYAIFGNLFIIIYFQIDKDPLKEYSDFYPDDY